MLNVCAISGTPRRGGNGDVLLQYALLPFERQRWHIRHFRLSEIKIQPCCACDRCRETNICIVEDDMVSIYEAFSWCDALIVSSPVYSRNINSQLMAVLDRHYAVNQVRPLEGKVGGAIAVRRGTCGGQTITINAIYNWMLSCGMICVPGELNGVTAVASEPGDILSQPNRLRQAKILGENILTVTKKLCV